jgi:hypothetical protein
MGPQVRSRTGRGLHVAGGRDDPAGTDSPVGEADAVRLDCHQRLFWRRWIG